MEDRVMQFPVLVIIVAMSDNGVIGDGAKMPWHLPADLQRVKRMTMGKPIVMGRKTYQSIGKPLPGRTNIIVSRDRGFKVEGITVIHNLEDALDVARHVAWRMVLTKYSSSEVPRSIARSSTRWDACI